MSAVVSDLVARWRDDAEVLAGHGADQAAATCRRHAAELEAALRAAADEALTLADAAAESGYSQDRLRHMVADGELPNAGRKGAPRIRRADLPQKRRRSGETFDAGDAARRVLGRG